MPTTVLGLQEVHTGIVERARRDGRPVDEASIDIKIAIYNLETC
jgi:hypothetical protein